VFLLKVEVQRFSGLKTQKGGSMCNYDASSTNPSYPSAHPQTGGYDAEIKRHEAVTQAANASAAQASLNSTGISPSSYNSPSPSYNDSGNSYSSYSPPASSSFSGSSSSWNSSAGGYSGGGGGREVSHTYDGPSFGEVMGGMWKVITFPHRIAWKVVSWLYGGDDHSSKKKVSGQLRSSDYDYDGARHIKSTLEYLEALDAWEKRKSKS
jgi:hypothetical protein